MKTKRVFAVPENYWHSNLSFAQLVSEESCPPCHDLGDANLVVKTGRVLTNGHRFD